MNNKIKPILIAISLIAIVFLINSIVEKKKEESRIEKEKQDIRNNLANAKRFTELALRKDNNEEAMKLIERSNEIIPTAENSDLACQILDDLNKFEEAISWCTQGHELGDDLSLLGVALAYRGVKNYEEALNWAFIANEKQIPGSAGTIGLVYSEIGDYVNAEKWYLQAIKDDPKDSQDLNNLISFYIEDLNNKILGAAYAIASVNNVFPAHTIAKFLIVTHQISLEDLQKAYEFQLNNPILPYKFEEKHRLGILNEKDYYRLQKKYSEE
ncbi:tetratricopeptide repeat protein [Aliarcobacter thereius]|uniref:Tetratricopeptide repeat protein n=1 Tax=Aliarcobacter thereius TaxID=544718 RepID=A0A5R9GWF1_9BACT|nr:tetratricopeptide repeat protein [Aliarcobacter thereius]TLS70952.1 tetratricopeptide repeat protein [Aliarcobacter thereius]